MISTSIQNNYSEKCQHVGIFQLSLYRVPGASGDSIFVGTLRLGALRGVLIGLISNFNKNESPYCKIEINCLKACFDLKYVNSGPIQNIFLELFFIKLNLV
jgi:hypothetical protein